MFRFSGFTRDSANLNSLFNSLLKQLKQIFNAEIKQNRKEKREIKETFFETLFKICSQNPEQKIIILIDAIDQLSNNVDYLFYNLPKNLKIIYTFTQDFIFLDYENEKMNNILKYNLLTIGKVDYLEAKQALEHLLIKVDRKLNREQQLKVDKCFEYSNDITALQIRLFFDITSKWQSTYTVPNEFEECVTTNQTVKYLLNRLQLKHGDILFSRCLFYFTLFGLNGISDSELEDILSIDDDVLDHIFQSNHLPTRRFPLSLWLSIKYDLRNYIVHKQTDDKLVVSWY